MKIRLIKTLGVVAVLSCAGMFLAGCQSPPVVLNGQLTIASGAPAVGVEVTVFSDTAQLVAASTVTDTHGDFQFDGSGLPDGTYRLRFGDNDWWSGAAYWTTATRVTISAANQQTIDAILGSGTITGTVQGPQGVLAGATVTALNSVTGHVAATAQSAADGTYALSGVPVGEYVIEFAAPGLATRFSSSVIHRSQAPVVSVAADTTIPNIDTTLVAESTISGSVVGEAPASGALVVAIDRSDDQVVSTTTTTAAGSFVLHGLNSEPVTIEVVASSYLPYVWGSPDGQLASALTITPPPAGAATLPSTIELIGTDCVPSKIASGNLTNANLVNCNLAGANLAGATLTGANLYGVSSGGVTGVPASLPPNWALVDGYLIGAHADLAGADLAGADLVGTDPESADLTGADLAGADLSQAYLDFSNLAGANLDGTRLGTAAMYYVASGGVVGTPGTLPANWTVVDGYLVGPQSNLTDADLSNADLAALDLAGAWFTGATLTSADLANANLTGAEFPGAIIGEANFSGATMVGVTSGGVAGTPAAIPTGWTVDYGYLVGPQANLTRAELHGLNLAGIDFSSVDMCGADLSDADLSGAQLTDVNMTGCTTGALGQTGTNLSGANFTGANLTGANMETANVAGAMFAGATLTALHAGTVIGIPASLPSGWSVAGAHLVGPYADLSYAHLRGVDLSNMDLSFVNFTGVDLSDADLTATDLADATMANVTLSGTDFTGANLTGVTSSGLTGTPAALPVGWTIVAGSFVQD
ncbi:MAG: pentapeptide repeat-containing protein [Actinobacteria bacterium]|nr:pentapeptide repeat-containing protein [Actinomycetota bacterium]